MARLSLLCLHLLLLLLLPGAKAGEVPLPPLKLYLHPSEHNVVLEGFPSAIRVEYTTPGEAVWLGVQAADPRVVRVLTDRLPLTANTSAPLHTATILLQGLRAGHTTLRLVPLTRNQSAVGPGAAPAEREEYRVSVVRHVELAEDHLLQASGAAQVALLLLLGLRLRPRAFRDLLAPPLVLLAASLGQAMLLPLVVLGAALSLGLHIHELLALLVMGCCPTALLTPALAVLHHASLDTALLLTLTLPILSFGSMPLWFYTCGHLLGLPYTPVWLPCWHLAAALGVVAAPVLLGLAIQLCVPQRGLEYLDRAVHPSSLAVTLFAIAVGSYGLWDTAQLVTWRMAVCATLIPLVCFLAGGLTASLFKQNFPQTKIVAMATSMQNTVLAHVIVRMSYPAPDGSLMAVTISCATFASLAWTLIFYFVHVMVWTVSNGYRHLHGTGGAGTLYHSLTDHLVHSMIKAGEISFRSKQSSGLSMRSCHSPALSERALVPTEHPVLGFNSLGFGNKVLAVCRDSLRRSGLQQGLSPRGPPFFPDTPSNCSSGSQPGSPGRKSSSERDTMSLEYEMMQQQQQRGEQADCSPRLHQHACSADSSKETFTVSSCSSDDGQRL